jgi:hypothetical protein
MNSITGNNTTQSAGIELTQRQRQFLGYLSQMTDAAQDFMIGLAEHNATRFPRQRPQFRLIAGGAA